MIVEPIDPDANVIGKSIIVADYLNTAIGNLIFWIEDGTTICKWKGIRSIPLRGSILGIIGSIDMRHAKKVIKG